MGWLTKDSHLHCFSCIGELCERAFCGINPLGAQLIQGGAALVGCCDVVSVALSTLSPRMERRLNEETFNFFWLSSTYQFIAQAQMLGSVASEWTLWWTTFISYPLNYISFACNSLSFLSRWGDTEFQTSFSAYDRWDGYRASPLVQLGAHYTLSLSGGRGRDEDRVKRAHSKYLSRVACPNLLSHLSSPLVILYWLFRLQE